MVSNDNKTNWPCTQAYARCDAVTDERCHQLLINSTVRCAIYDAALVVFENTLSLVHAGIQVHTAASVHTHARQQNC